MEPASPSVHQGRVCIVVASVLWSLGGALSKVLTRETAFQLHEPALENAGLLIAFYRTLFAGLFFLPMLRRGEICFRPSMLVMVGFFTTINVLYVSAKTMSIANNTIFLQYSASMWMYLASIWFL